MKQTWRSGNVYVIQRHVRLRQKSSFEVCESNSLYILCTHRPLYYVELLDCLVMQISKQPTWQQLNALRQVDIVKMSC